MGLSENMKFSDGEYTLIERDKTYELYAEDPSEFLKLINEHLESLANQTFLLDWLTVYISKHYNLKYNKDNVNDVYEFIKRLFLNAGFNGDRSASGFNPHFLKEWIKGRYIISKREDAFRFGFILKLTETDFAEFMLKACLMSTPYNFKSVDESVYFFCLKEGRNYFDARRIIDEIENASIKENMYADNETAVIYGTIASIKEEKELIKYLVDNKFGFKKQYRSAVNELSNQLKLAHLNIINIKNNDENRIIDDIKKATLNDIKNIDESKLNISTIFKEITGYDPRRIVNGKKALDSIRESDFPKLVIDNFPSPQKISKLINDKTEKPSENDLRKALIMLIFYNEYCIEGNDGQYCDVKEFWDTTDSILYKCGCVQFYPRNPYDAMFSYCAIGDEPVETFRELIEKYYTEKKAE